MSFTLVLLFLLLQPLHTSWADIYGCSQEPMSSICRDGDIVLGGFFPLYYKAYDPDISQTSFLHKPGKEVKISRWLWKNYQFVLALYFSIKEINRDTSLLPNVSLGFSVYNGIASDHFTLWTPLIWLTGKMRTIPNYSCHTYNNYLSIITGTAAAFSAQIGTLLELYKIPQITFGAFDPMLSDRDHFPSLYQMAPKDNFLASAMISLLLHFCWTWVAIFTSDDMKGENFLQELEAEMVKKGICVALTQKLPVTKIMYAPSDINFMTRIRVSSANVHILYGEAGSLITVDIAAEFFLTTGKVWIMTGKWDIVMYEMNHILHSFHGGFSFSPQKGEIPGFKHFLKTVNPSHYPEDFYILMLWISQFLCKPAGFQDGNNRICPPNTSLEFLPGNFDLITISDSSYFVYNSVYMLAHALHHIILENIEVGYPRDTDSARILPWQLHPFLKKIQFTNSAGDHVSLDEKRNYVTQYDIQNAVNFPAGLGLLVKVGEYLSKRPYNQNLVIKDEMIEWPVGFTETPQSVCSQSCHPGFRKISLEGQPVCCFACVFCPERHISNQTDAEECMECPVSELPNSRRDHCIPKIVTFLAFEDSLGIALSCTALCLSLITAMVLWVFVKHQDTPIVKANNRALSYTLLISLTCCFLCSLLFLGRPSAASCILQQITFGVVFTVAVSTVLAKTITVVLAFKVMKPGTTIRWWLVSGASNCVIPICTLIQFILCAIWLGTSPPFIDTDAQSERDYVILLCNKGSVTAFYCSLGYLGSLALGSFTLAFLARNLPDTFNEAKLLTFSMVVFCSVWVTFLPVYHSTKGKFMVAVEVFSILASSAGLLGCIFAPKCYIILIRPEKNSLKMVKVREDSRRNACSVSSSHKF